MREAQITLVHWNVINIEVFTWFSLTNWRNGFENMYDMIVLFSDFIPYDCCCKTLMILIHLLCVLHIFMVVSFLNFLQLVTMQKENGFRTIIGLYILGSIVSNGCQGCGPAGWHSEQILPMRSFGGSLNIVKWKNLKGLNSWGSML